VTDKEEVKRKKKDTTTKHDMTGTD
jgi:hypothetical protein